MFSVLSAFDTLGQWKSVSNSWLCFSLVTNRFHYTYIALCPAVPYRYLFFSLISLLWADSYCSISSNYWLHQIKQQPLLLLPIVYSRLNIKACILAALCPETFCLQYYFSTSARIFASIWPYEGCYKKTLICNSRDPKSWKKYSFDSCYLRSSKSLFLTLPHFYSIQNTQNLSSMYEYAYPFCNRRIPSY